MKTFFAVTLLAAAMAACAATALAQSPPPPPALTAAQTAKVEREIELYRHEVDDRVARSEITKEEGQRLYNWRSWQLAQQQAGLAPKTSVVERQAKADAERAEWERRMGAVQPYYYDYEPYYYEPYYYAPYYALPPIYYWGW